MRYLIAKPQLFQLLWLLLLLSPAMVLSRVLVSAPAPAPAHALPDGTMGGLLPPGCPPDSMCGDVHIPFPFSIIEGCALSESFRISCNDSYYNAPRPYYREYEVENITPETSEMNISAPMAHIYNFTGSPFLISPEKLDDAQVLLVLDWAIPASMDGACGVSEYSRRENVTGDQGYYLCRCLEGYHGNPYVDGGCMKIEECRQGMSDCGSNKKCIQIDGRNECKCKLGRRGQDCRPIFPAVAAAVLSTFVATLLLALLLWLVWKERKQRMRRGFFDKNGGELFKHMNITTFTELQLEKITDHSKTPIGRGAFGKVFRGTTHENLRVAVKRSIVEGMRPSQDHDLVNEIAIQFQVSHANLVRLVGCCLETDVPMLVFVYVSNGSLYNVLHCGSTPRVLPLLARLDIAIGSAKALAYMHSHGGRSLVHGDVKSGNILLGDNLTPKVSDFGSSKLESVARHGNWCVMGDMNYIDPVYTKTGRFTQKSDVYSFGVVLLELITRKTARYDNNSSLPIDFVKSFKEEGNARKMYDRDIILSDGTVPSDHHVECLDQIGMLAVRCLKEDVDERPSIEEVVEELVQVKLRVRGNTRCKLRQVIGAYMKQKAPIAS